MNNVNIIGRVVNDLEAKLTTNGTKFCSFRIAVDAGNDKTYFFNCIAWKERCDNIIKYFHKGDKIGISGTLSSRNYEDDGKKRSIVEIIVNSFDFCNGRKVEQTGQPAVVETNEGNFEQGSGEVPFEI